MTQINRHILRKYKPEFANQRQFCSMVSDVPMTVFDVCREEFEYILRVEGFKEIEELFNGKTSLSIASTI
ncbi:MAG: hypothetical protein ABSC53_07650 [Bacteroidota bacterium]|jgi:hypothetical protein